jgi:hypothetical protein
LLLQHAPPLQQFSPLAAVVFLASTLADSLFFIGQELPLQQQLAEAASPDDFIGQEPFLQQQSSRSQHDVFA